MGDSPSAVIHPEAPMLRILPSSRRAASAAAVVAALLLTACQDEPTTASGVGPQASVAIRAELAGTAVQALSIQISGPAIASPLVVNVPVAANATAVTATLSIPVGAQRTLLVRGFDGDGIQTHEGLATVTVKPVNNAAVAIRLYPKTGDVPITIGGAAYAIVLTPATLPDASLGDTRQLTAVVADASGSPVAGAVPAWGSLNPVVASVDASGLVTARVAGTTTLFASWGGAAASVDLTVLGPPLVFREISAGGMSTCALDDAGATWCWGHDSNGQLGVGGSPEFYRAVPSPVAGGQRFKSITVGFRHACAVTLTGQAYCWGFNGDGSLGIGPPTPGNVERSIPTAVVGGLSWSRLFAGPQGTCGITTAGVRYCWGFDAFGELGLGSVIFPTPTPVGIAGGPWSSIALGGTRACALAASGAVSCIPQSAVAGDFLTDVPGTDWRAVALNDITAITNFTSSDLVANISPTACGLTSAGAVRCWGAGARGALGTGSVADAPAPVQVAGVQGYEAISLGGEFACGLRSRLALCWGRNDAGQLGDGTTTDRLVPSAVNGSFVRISAGLGHVCALRADGAALCWGAGQFGQLGDGGTTGRPVPTLVARPLTP